MHAVLCPHVPFQTLTCEWPTLAFTSDHSPDDKGLPELHVFQSGIVTESIIVSGRGTELLFFGQS